MVPIIKLDKISFTYPPAMGTAGKEIFKDFSLQVEQKETLVIGGKSGCGKTTLLRLLAWLEEPGGGEIFLEGKSYHDFYPPDLRRTVSLVSQIPVMLEGSTRHNLTIGLNEPADDDYLFTWMDQFDLEVSLLDLPAGSLSVGQQQRVAVIRNLLVEPKILLLDEPTSGLDPASSRIFIEAMTRLSKENGLTIIWNSHYVEALESLATKTIWIDGESE